MISQPFHIYIHARPIHASAGPAATIAGQKVATLTISADAAARSLPVTFDQALAALDQLPRMFAEPDGSFVWTGDGWQLDGVLYDRGDRLHYVELKGTCDRDAWVTLQGFLTGELNGLMIQLVQQAVFVEIAEFKRLVGL